MTNKNLLIVTILALSLVFASSLELRREAGTQQPLATSAPVTTDTLAASTVDSAPAVKTTAAPLTTTAALQADQTPQTLNATAAQTSAPVTQSASKPYYPPPTFPPIDDIDAKMTKLMLARTQTQRMDILNNDKDFVFDFFDPSVNVTSRGRGGKTITADRENFPGIFGNGMSMTVGIIGPCGLNTPHSHPRATELTYAINGTFDIGFIAENGARVVANTVSPGQMAVIPKGATHWIANLGCSSVSFVSSYNDEDPGFSQLAQTLFDLPEDVLTATLGGVDDSTIGSIAASIPADVSMGLMTCLKKCGFVKPPRRTPTYPTYPSYPGYSGYGNPTYSNSNNNNNQNTINYPDFGY